MKRIGIRFTVFMLVFILSACSANKETVTSFHDSFKNMEESMVSPADWGELEKEANKIRKKYEDHLWKMQLLGNKIEYGSLKHEISKLKAAILSKDEAQVSIHIATINSYLSSIFNYDPDNPPDEGKKKEKKKES